MSTPQYDLLYSVRQFSSNFVFSVGHTLFLGQPPIFKEKWSSYKETGGKFRRPDRFLLEIRIWPALTENETAVSEERMNTLGKGKQVEHVIPRRFHPPRGGRGPKGQFSTGVVNGSN